MPNTYTWPCPRCGRTCTDNRKYVARAAGPCLQCIRAENGWQHQPGCTLDDEHRGPCQ